MYKRIVVKVGSRVISEGGKLNEVAVRAIVEQVAELRRRGVEVVLVTSGATATGKGVFGAPSSRHSIEERQVYASVGQIRLMHLYAKYFNELGQICGQILVTKGDFRDRQHYANIKNCFLNLLKKGVIPVVNENDAIAISKLIFSDNDELAGLIASQLDADAVIILTNVEGVMIGEGGKTAAVPEVHAETAQEIERYIDASISASGRGGMKTKFEVAKKLMTQGIVTYIVNGEGKHAILDVVEGKPLGTKFVPEGKLSGVKRRLAHAEGFASGVAYVNPGAEEILTSKKAVSLLPVGITKIEGSFKKGDVIEVRGESGTKLGFGIAQYDSMAAKDALGKKGERALIHYDYLFIGR